MEAFWFSSHRRHHSLSSNPHDDDRHGDGLREFVLEKRRVFRGEDPAATNHEGLESVHLTPDAIKKRTRFEREKLAGHAWV